ncbi:MAG: DUF6017 domain-containing protein [Eubacteriales bacterium]
MAVFRIEKTKDYTVMANHHLRNKELSLKAKGLLSLMLSLPESWDYTTKGLASICKDGVDSINGTIKELENSGYVIRERTRNEKGQLTATEYTILEEPKKPVMEKPILEKHDQLNTNISNTDLLNINQSNPNQSKEESVDSKTDGMGKEENGYVSYENIKEIVYANIEFEHFQKHGSWSQQDRIGEIADIIIETLCSTKPFINIAGEDYPAKLVKEKLLKITSSHVTYVLECLDNNTTYIRNIKRYLLTTLFNAPSTIDSYYTAQANYDMKRG